ncbi:MAG TPA: response regulator [Cyclobacteriaceae bacterium]|nr:response regulator [Cyclobacteriaceae bacterium]
MKKETILIADDTSDLLNNMVESLEIEGYKVIETKDGDAALTELQKMTPDLIITDLLMARVDGFELIKVVRADSRWKGIPILVHSAMAERDVIDKALNLGATAYVVKPCSIEVFLNAVSDAIKSKKV